MANIAITTACNLDCSYCFAKKFRQLPAEGEMKFTDFTKAINWINTSDRDDEPIGIIGGEPLLHPLFDDFLELARMKKRPEQGLQVFSNGIILDEHLDAIARSGAAVSVNVNSPEDIGKNTYERVFNNIALLRMRNIPFGVGINLYRPMDLTFFLDVIKEFGVDSFRIGLTAPNEGGKSSFEYFEIIQDTYLELIEAGARLGSAAGIDCLKMPSCFLEKHIARIDAIRENTGLDICVGDGCSSCTPVIDITPTLHLTRCFGTLRQGLLMPMSAFRTIRDAESFYATNIDNIAQLIPAEEKCEKCYEKSIGVCQGGCLGFKLDEFLDVQFKLKDAIIKPKSTVNIEL